MFFLIKWAILSLAILSTPYFIPGVHVESFGAALAAALILGLLNIFLRPLLLLLTLPLTIVTLGFFILVINAICFHLAAGVVSGLAVESFGSSFLASLFISIVSWVSNMGINRKDGRTRFVVRNVRTFRGDNRMGNRTDDTKDVTPR